MSITNAGFPTEAALKFTGGIIPVKIAVYYTGIKVRGKTIPQIDGYFWADGKTGQVLTFGLPDLPVCIALFPNVGPCSILIGL